MKHVHRRSGLLYRKDDDSNDIKSWAITYIGWFKLTVSILVNLRKKAKEKWKEKKTRKGKRLRHTKWSNNVISKLFIIRTQFTKSLWKMKNVQRSSKNMRNKLVPPLLSNIYRNILTFGMLSFKIIKCIVFSNGINAASRSIFNVSFFCITRMNECVIKNSLSTRVTQNWKKQVAYCVQSPLCSRRLAIFLIKSAVIVNNTFEEL